MTQMPLLELRPRFDGASFDPAQDADRLTKQLDVVRDYMLRAGWQTLAEIEQATHAPQASVSARLRDLRKIRHGAYTVERRRRTQGQYEYRVTR